MSSGDAAAAYERRKRELERRMTTDRVTQRVADISAASGDPEMAHSLEDDLWRDVLTEIAYGHGEAQELAREALRTTRLNFPRWAA